ncbi:MAG TPA: DNA-processing protein DprA [Myxococcaceae bacterium]|jgi:DNA protecting protein DprA|nr:DNA-processing protein DprA [Myxococcaceae bacterium]
MAALSSLSHSDRQALLALWAVPGLGPVGLAELAGRVDRWADLLDLPADQWAHGVKRVDVRGHLLALERLRPLAERLREQAEEGGMTICFPGDAGFPARLAEIPNAPPLIFRRGTVRPARRRVAMVGTRRPAPEFYEWAREFAHGVAAGGAGVVSGAAQGVDQACHFGALDAGGETWAFLGSALDAVDPGVSRVVERILDGGGSVFSELPPGVRASRETFPPRNRLISGAADAVVVLRAADLSGSFYTAEAALAQGRPLLAVPGEAARADAAGTNRMICLGSARACLGPEDALRAAGVHPQDAPPPPARAEPVRPESLSTAARAAFASVSREPMSFEEVQIASRLDPGVLASALCELELLGLVQQGPGKYYERV